VAIILLIICSAFVGTLSHLWNVTKNQLANTEAQLANTVVKLDTTEAQLTDTKTLLHTTKTQLADTEAQLGATKAQLADTEAQLDVTKTQLATTIVQWDTTKALLTKVESQLETAKNNNSQLLNQYAGLKSQINVRLGLTSQDRQSFITPNNSVVSAKVQEITGGYTGDTDKYWRDFERLYRWVVANISYSNDSPMPLLPETISGPLIWREECWRTPEETLREKTGDCEDMAALLASMLRNYNEGRYRVWILGIKSNDPGVKRHVGVAFPVAGGRLTILDPAGNYYTGYPYGSLQSESSSVAVRKWLSHWMREMPGAEIYLAFSEDSYQEFSSTAEFLTWLKE